MKLLKMSVFYKDTKETCEIQSLDQVDTKRPFGLVNEWSVTKTDKLPPYRYEAKHEDSHRVRQ